ncbi:TPA: hypothetical protein QFV80_004685 [Klebsiella aerogenes]|nr:hypothetical protein [Klebsiella aerogenes]HDT6521846.1 hypothetical protein [Klebsiella aerogenes]
MSVQSPGYPGLCCFCSIFPRHCAWTGYWWCGLWGFPAALRLDGLLVVRLWGFPAALRLDGLLMVGPVGFPAALRLAGLLVGGAACGMGSPGEAFMPTPGRAAVPHAKKEPVLSYGLLSRIWR